MEKIDERKRHIWTALVPTKKKNINGACEVGSYEGILIEHWIEEKFSLRYEIDCLVVKKIKRKTIRRDDCK